MGRSKEQFEKTFNKKFFAFLGKTIGIARFKPVKKAIPMLRPNGLNATYIPVNRDIELPESAPIPLTLLYNIIERAGFRFIVDFCTCRRAMECRKHSAEIGCLMMGTGAREIHPTMGREVSVREATEHVEKAMKNGLVPMVGKSLVENIVFGISKENRDKFFVACFCCDCCCLSRFLKQLPPAVRNENIIKLESLSVVAGDSCTGCGKCRDSCFMGAIRIEDGRALIGEGCVGCGRCELLCPNKAIRIKVNNSEYVNEAMRRLESLVDIH